MLPHFLATRRHIPEDGIFQPEYLILLQPSRGKGRSAQCRCNNSFLKRRGRKVVMNDSKGEIAVCPNVRYQYSAARDAEN
jgi:hypothetical protein